jgi:glycosyltransferase involved in cell wall biosynthesis
MSKVSCIIPAYNEGKRIGAVLQAVCGHSLIDEVLVVDDCSNDETKDIVKQFKEIQIIQHFKNEGKSQSVLDGILKSRGDLIFLLDADLIGLTAKNITDMIEPVVSRTADITVSLRKSSPWFYRLIRLDFISGERVFSRKLIERRLEAIKSLSHFGLETYLNKCIIESKYRIKVVTWNNVISPWPHKKRGFFLGVKSFIFMIRDILKTTSIFGVGYQIMRMTLLKIK